MLAIAKTSAPQSPKAITAAVCCDLRTTAATLTVFGIAEVFLCAASYGHTIIEMRRIHLSCKRQGIAKWGCAKRAPENRNEVRFLGKGGTERACEHCRFAAM